MREVTLTLTGGKTLNVPVGTPFSALEEHFSSDARPLAAVRVNNEIQPLSAWASVDAKVEPVPLASAGGATVHRHTLSFVLCAAARHVFAGRSLRAGHSLGSAYYFSFADDKALDEAALAALASAIDALIAADKPIEKRRLPFGEALDYFCAEGHDETALLLRQTGEAAIKVNELDGYRSVYTCPLLPRTGLLSGYKLHPYQDGFLLRYPVCEGGGVAGGAPPAEGAVKDHKAGWNEGETSPFTLPSFNDLPGIFEVFRESKRWGRIAGVHAAAQLNELVAKRGIKEFIWTAEAFTDKRLLRIADAIYKQRDDIRLVLIAGPSSSGKTTTAKRLSIHLKTAGIEPVSVSLDDYYLHPDKVPRDEKGAPDFECLGSLDVPFLNSQLLDLFSGKEITLPVFDFKTGARKEGRKIKLERRMMLVLEGIHGLNDALTPDIPRKNKFKLYASALTQLNIDDHNRIATTDNRLLRRMVRDNQFRGIGAERTLKMWPDVQRGAEKHIFTFQNDADAVFNTAMDYEIAVLKTYAEPLLRSVHPDCSEFSEASRILSLLSRFAAVPSELVPPLSILREFIGGSGFKY